jgi:YD repeat-containing protein
VTTYEYAATDALNALNPAGRLTKVNRPDGGWTAYAYGMQPDNLFLMTRTAQDQTHNLDAYQYFDKLGRPTRAAQSEGSGSFVYSDTQYDLMGRVRQVSNPYRTGETVRWTSTAYDDLGRPFRVTTPDAAQVLTIYGISVGGTTLGPTVTVQDQTLRKRKSVADALGRLTQVYEDPDGNNFLTSYAYDVLGNLRTVSQGVQTRSFLYDSLSRLTSAMNPESGTIQYQYDANSNLILKIDPRPRPGNITLSDCPVNYTGSLLPLAWTRRRRQD